MSLPGLGYWFCVQASCTFSLWSPGLAVATLTARRFVHKVLQLLRFLLWVCLASLATVLGQLSASGGVSGVSVVHVRQ
jgi:hypothetical protein